MDGHFEDDARQIQPTKRSLAAAKRRADKQAKADAKAADYRRRVFVALHGESRLEEYGPVRELLWGKPQEYEPTGHFDIDDVIADIVPRYHLPTMDDPNAPEDQEPGFGGLDLTIWRGGRLLAVLRPGDGGGPVVSRFDT
jgi:hypothetical protein